MNDFVLMYVKDGAVYPCGLTMKQREMLNIAVRMIGPIKVASMDMAGEKLIAPIPIQR